jgi:putative hydrolase of the HAD superfamily
LEAARDQLFAQFRALQGNLDWYCLDHWSDRLGMDMLELHRDVNHRIGYLPGAKEFLQAVREHDTRVIMVTNSHPDTLALKDEVTGLVEYFDGVYTSHGFGYVKESQEFWCALQDEVGFDTQTTLMVDDTVSVLESAATYGVEMLLTVTRPDTTEPVRGGSDFTGVEAVADML